jgi:hypothetical protein
MYKSLDHLSEDDRRLVRKWTLVSVGFYGSLLAGLISYVAFIQGPPANFASDDPVSRVSAAKPALEMAAARSTKPVKRD